MLKKLFDNYVIKHTHSVINKQTYMGCSLNLGTTVGQPLQIAILKIVLVLCH